MERRLLDILATKPTLVFNFPDWMLPGAMIDEIQETANTIIVEMAGRDSVAAVIKATSMISVKTIIPTIAYSGTEFGSWEILLKKTAFLKERLKSLNIKVIAPVFLGDPRLWRVLCGRYATHLFKRFDFYTPCVGCHLYFHILRIPLAKMLSCKMVVGGEREAHDGKIKLNQIGIALDSYINLLHKFGVELVLPLRHVKSGNDIEAIVGQHWEEGEEQMQCIMASNYRDIDGTAVYVDNSIKRYFEEFALNIAEKAVGSYLEKKTPEYEKLIQSP
jgi:hypothetical protein